MIYEEFNVMLLEPVKYTIADIRSKKKAARYKNDESVTLLKKARSKGKKAAVNYTDKYEEKGQPQIKKAAGGGGIIDLLIRNCFICFIILAVFTAINIAGFGQVMNNLKEIAENRSIGGIFAYAEFL